MSKNSNKFNPEKLNLIPFSQLDEKQHLENDWINSTIERIEKDGIFRLKHLSLSDFGLEKIETLSPKQLWYMLSDLDGTFNNDIISRTIFSEVGNIFKNFTPWHLRKIVNRHLPFYDIEKLNVPQLYTAIASKFYLGIISFWQPKILPGIVENFSRFLNQKNSTYTTALKNLQSDYRGLNRGNEFREVVIDLTNDKVVEIENLFEPGGYYNNEQIKIIQSLPKTKKVDFGVEMTNLLQEIIKRSDQNTPLKNAVKELKGPLNQRKYFTYAILSDYFPKEYPKDTEIRKLLESDQVEVTQKMITKYKRERIRKLF